MSKKNKTPNTKVDSQPVENPIVDSPIDIKKQLKELRNTIKAKQKELATKGKDVLKALVKSIFDKHSWVEKFSFHGYTPYFNDGDVCKFGVHYDDPKINDAEEYDFEGEVRAKYKVVADDIAEEMRKIKVEEWEMMFDDHWELTFYRNGKMVKREYEHD